MPLPPRLLAVAPKPQMFLGIDSSLNGFASSIVIDTGKSPWQSRLFPPPKDTVGWSRNDAIIHGFQDWFSNYIDPGLTIAVIEGYSMGGKFQGRSWDRVELAGCIKYRLLLAGVRVIAVAPKAAKRWLTGNGSATKGDMGAALIERFGHHTSDNNIADAVALAKYGQAIYVYGQKLKYDALPPIKIMA